MKAIFITSLIVLSALVVGMSVCAPEILAQNKFLLGFVSYELLSILAVIMTIAIASISIIHIWFNELEDKHQKRVFGRARREINQSANSLIFLFVGSVGLLFVKSLPIFEHSQTAQSLFHGAAITILLSSVVTLTDIMGVVRALTPED